MVDLLPVLKQWVRGHPVGVRFSLGAVTIDVTHPPPYLAQKTCVANNNQTVFSACLQLGRRKLACFHSSLRYSTGWDSAWELLYV